jgi:hypothetical protein
MDADLLWKLAPIGTGIVGYIGGILSEPIKTILKRKQELSMLRRALYAEMLRNFDVIETAFEKSQSDPHYFDGYNPYKDYLTFECYEFARKTQPLTFNLLVEVTAITKLYVILYSLVNEPRNPEHLAAYTEDIYQSILSIVRGQVLNPFLLHEVDQRHLAVLPWRRRVQYRITTFYQRLHSSQEILQLGNLTSIEPKRERAIDKRLRQKEEDLKRAREELRKMEEGIKAKEGRHD